MGSSYDGLPRNLALRTAPALLGLESHGTAPMRLRVRKGTVVTAVSVAVSFLTVCVPAVGSASAATSDAATATASWAYGAIHTGGGSGVEGAYTFTSSETVGYAVVLNETQPSPGNYTIAANRTMGVLLSVEFCRPSCAHAVVTASELYHVWESIRATVDLTTDGTVTVGTTPTPALALASTSVAVTTGLVESVKVVDNGTVLRSHNLTVALNASTSTTFTPALGLVPLRITGPNTYWNATSAFVTTGSASWSVVYASLFGGSFSKNGTLVVTPSGAVTLSGSFLGPTIRLGGTTYDQLGLSLVGPFALREGFLLIPDNANLLINGAPDWLSELVSVNGSANYSQERVDVASAPTSGPHLGFGGSYVLWTSASANPALASALPAAEPAPAAAAQPSAASNATYVQSEPQTVPQAESYQHCLVSGVGCPVASSPRGIFGFLVVAGVVAVAALLAGVVVVERRRVPPPNYPNAALYPPGSPSGAPASALRPRTPPSPPAEDDPLGNLW